MKVIIPEQLKKVVGGQKEISVNDFLLNVHCVILDLGLKYPEFLVRVMDKEGKVNRFINVYVNGEDIRFLQGLDTRVYSSDEILIQPAYAGG